MIYDSVWLGFMLVFLIRTELKPEYHHH